MFVRVNWQSPIAACREWAFTLSSPILALPATSSAADLAHRVQRVIAYLAGRGVDDGRRGGIVVIRVDDGGALAGARC